MGVIVKPLGAVECGSCKLGWHETLREAIKCAERHKRLLSVEHRRGR